MQKLVVTLPMSKKPYQISQSLDSKYMIPDRVIGTSGHKTSAMLYIAAGVSGAMQHVMGNERFWICCSN